MQSRIEISGSRILLGPRKRFGCVESVVGIGDPGNQTVEFYQKRLSSPICLAEQTSCDRTQDNRGGERGERCVQLRLQRTQRRRRLNPKRSRRFSHAIVCEPVIEGSGVIQRDVGPPRPEEAMYAEQFVRWFDAAGNRLD
jgi:hypothetical protein